MKTICIAGLKGGIGKTTTTTTLAYLLQAEKEKRVLLIDADCQANATMTYGVEPSDDGIADIMSYALKGDTPDIKKHIVTTDYGVDIVPSSTGLQVVNGRLQVEREHSQIDVLKRALSEIENEYDYCIIDCGLQLDITVLNAICASNLVLSPHKIGGFEEQGSDVSVESLAIKLTMLNNGIELVEKAAMLTDDKLAAALLRYCTTPGMSFRELCGVETVNCSESTFYRKRSEFFRILDKLKEESFYSELPRKYRTVEKHHRGKWTS